MKMQNVTFSNFSYNALVVCAYGDIGGTFDADLGVFLSYDKLWVADTGALSFESEDGVSEVSVCVLHQQETRLDDIVYETSCSNPRENRKALLLPE